MNLRIASMTFSQSYGWKFPSFVAALVLFTHQGFAEEAVDYTRQIKPILQSRCYACHGALKQEGGLRLDTGDTLRTGGDSGEVITITAPDDSLLIERVTAADSSERMPPEGEPLSEEQIRLFKRWIAAGAQSPADEIPEADPRDHWAFRPLQRPDIPELEQANARDRNPVDAFIQDRLAQEGLSAGPAASKHQQLRRVYLDLIGLPPTSAELKQFVADESTGAYERVVDRLLNDPRYGERWGRHWMDVWRYSDWYGRRNVPDVWNSAPQVWRWRDWIIHSLNEDKSYGQMIQEMLAGDEISPDDPQTAVATGYLIRNWYALNPNDWMRNTVEHTGKAFLGLTFNCAHCHDHKYDPITQEDYFRLRAFFEPMYVRQDRIPGEADPGPFQDYDYSTLRKIQHLGSVRVFDKVPDATTWFYTDGDERNRDQERGSVAPGVPAVFTPTSLKINPIELPTVAWYPGFHPEIQATVRADAQAQLKLAETQLATATKSHETIAAEEKTNSITEHHLLVARAAEVAARAELASVEARIAADNAQYHPSSERNPEEFTQRAAHLEHEATLRRLESDTRVAEHTLLVAENKSEEDADRTQTIEAAKKAVQEAEERYSKATAEDSTPIEYTKLSPVYPQKSTGRRRALAEWITHRDNPLTARVAVNHIWMRHFHVPIVATVDDFGRNGAAPSHPELLDWLAVEFIENNWSMKRLHRLIVTSNAYRRSSSQTEKSNSDRTQKLDPDNTFLWRMNVGRMEAEVIRDSLFFAGGLLDMTLGGRSLANEQALTTYRRSLYYEVFPEDGGASVLSSLFDAPNPLECYRRTKSIVPQQALALTNSEMVHVVSERIAEIHNSTEDNQQFIKDAFFQILSRSPGPEELQLCEQALTQQVELYTEAGVAAPQTAARQSVIRSILNHNDFVTIR